MFRFGTHESSNFRKFSDGRGWAKTKKNGKEFLRCPIGTLEGTGQAGDGKALRQAQGPWTGSGLELGPESLVSHKSVLYIAAKQT